MIAIPPDSHRADPAGRIENASRTCIFSVLVVIVLFTEISPLQYTMLASSLQKIAPSFPGVGADINWSVIVFGLIAAACAPLIGKLSDRWGKRRMFVICGLFFLVGSVIDAATSSWALFLLGRCLQSVAGATALCAYGLIRDLMPRRLVPLGLGVAATGLGLSALVAPLIGGWLVDAYNCVRLDPTFTYGNGFSILQYALHIALLSSLAAMVCGAIAGHLTRRIGARIPLLIALVLMTATGICYTLVPFRWEWLLLLGGIYGVGFGMFSAANPILITEAVPAEKQGISTGMLGVAQGVGTAIGLAVITAFLNAHPIHAEVSLSGNRAGGALIPNVFGDDGYILGFAAAVAATAVALVIVIFMRHGRAPATGGSALVTESGDAITATTSAH